MNDWRHAQIETLAVHAGRTADESSGAVAAPIQLSTTFERAADGSFPHGFSYGRSDNPNRQALEIALAAMEGGSGAAAFASGCAATTAIFQSLNPGDYVIAPADAYYGTKKLLSDLFSRWGLEARFVDMTVDSELDSAFQRPPRLVWVETPSNPLLKISNIAALAQRAHDAGGLLVCDNTCGPTLQRPLDLGADLLIHSTTKYIGGHSDVLGGVVVAKDPAGIFETIRQVQGEAGAVPSPFDCWLVLRGLRTLPWRMRAHSENALAVAKFLASHKKIQRVHYPGLETNPAYKVAAKQMRAFSGVLSFEVKGGRDEAMKVAANTKLFMRATSLGGVESLIEHRASIEGPGTRTPESLLRASIGLEHPDDLIADLEQAL